MTVEVEQTGGRDEPVLTVRVLTDDGCTAEELPLIEHQIDRLLGISVDLGGFYDLADADRRVGRLKDRMLGVKPPRFPTLFEALINAIANQQLSLEVGIELLNRFTERFGTPVADHYGLVAFPAPEAVLAASLHDLCSLGFSARKAESVMVCADAVQTGTIEESNLASLERDAATEELVGLRGIGRWSAEYVLLRGLGRIDVFPADDVGARNKLQRFLALTTAPKRDEIVAWTAQWSPFAGMIYFHLLLDGLAERGVLDA